MNDREQQTLLATYCPWLRAVSAGMTSRIPQWTEDLAQEGWVAMWRALVKADGSSPTDYWLKRCATARMSSVMRDWQAQCRDIRRTTLIADWTEFDGVGALEAVEPAYHDGDLLAVLNELSLSDREYVWRRFWGDIPRTELHRRFGHQWSRIQAELCERLLMQIGS